MQPKIDRSNLDKYCRWALERGATHVKPITPASIVTAAWVQLKCQFGCPRYNKGYCCPPYTPTSEQTRAMIDSYRLAILFHIEAPKAPDRAKIFREYYAMLTDLEGDLFKNGYYKAFVFLSGPCRLCNECNASKQIPCAFPYRARPSMEGCGIDVYQTARNNDFFIQPLRERTETQNHFCLMLVD